jgi:stage III sporulation protein AE
MKRLIVILFLLPFLLQPVTATTFEAPEVPDSGKEWMPYEAESFADGIISIFRDAIDAYQPALAASAGDLLRVVGIVILLSCVKSLPGTPDHITQVVGVLAISILFMGSSGTLIRLAADTVGELSEYAKLLFPVLTAAFAAQGGITSSAALYTGTMAFVTLLGGLATAVIVPLAYIFLCLCILSAAIEQAMVNKIKDLIKWLITWALKLTLYIFTGYMSITGVVSGSTDAAALKATKIAISGMVPVVGGIMSDTSEAVLVGARVMKNTVGIYGMYAILAVWIGPFLEIGIQYLLLKAGYGICSVFPVKKVTGLLKDFSGAMGLLLALTGTLCLMLMVGIVCFMKGVN